MESYLDRTKGLKLDDKTQDEEILNTDHETTDPDIARHSEMEKKPGIIRSVFGFESWRSFFMVIVAIIIFRSSVMSPYHVPTGSMEPTIKVGDRLLAWKLAYELKFPIPFTDIDINFFRWGQPDRGDIIVFRYPKDLNIDYVKRVVAVAGDKVELKDNILYINGKAQEQVSKEDQELLKDLNDSLENKLLFEENLEGSKHWVLRNKPSPLSFFSNSDWPGSEEVYTVPEESVFVMGDNRDNSQDSRIWGEVPLSYVRGEALFVIWSVYQSKNSSWPSLRFERMGHWL